MIQLLLFILKLIGWILLGVLGLILGILLLVLFCAVRYRIDGKKEEKLEGNLRISWLFGIISLTVRYQDALLIQAKLFGKTVWKMDGKRGEGEAEEFPESEGSGKAEELSEDEESGKAEKCPESEGIGKAEKFPESKEIEKTEETTIEKKADKNKRKREEKARAEALQKELDALTAERKKRLSEEKAEEGPSAPGKEEKKSLWEKINAKLAAWIKKLQFSFSEICGKLRQIEEKRQWLLAKWDWLSQMIHDPENQASVRLIFRQVKKILRHLLWRKGSVSLVFGREDPYLMGKLLGYAGAAYPFTHQFLTLHPVFGENRLEGEVHIRGRIRLGIILGYGLRLLLNKTIRRKLKEVLHGR